MNVRIYSVHIETLTEEGGWWEGWDVVNVALTDDAHAAPEAMAQGLEMCKKGNTETLRVREVRFIGEGKTA